MHLKLPNQQLPELDRFLAAGPPPIYAGFGSMPVRDQIRNMPLIADAARRAGQRVVIGKFWDAPSELANSDDVFFIKKYPHRKLFPQMAAVVHHGGAGTTATTAISGVPQIIVPHLLDQYYWGNQVYQSGLGPRPIWRSKLTAAKLARAIRETLSNGEIHRKTGEVSRLIKQRDSLEITVTAIMNSLQSMPNFD
jgi:UDP:flavonoid glycosyltransferase YjiC (YdhE family)